jgi:hypothetical protein
MMTLDFFGMAMTRPPISALAALRNPVHGWLAGLRQRGLS